jgi:hypothetical protein
MRPLTGAPGGVRKRLPKGDLVADPTGVAARLASLRQSTRRRTGAQPIPQSETPKPPLALLALQGALALSYAGGRIGKPCAHAPDGQWWKVRLG